MTEEDTARAALERDTMVERDIENLSGWKMSGCQDGRCAAGVTFKGDTFMAAFISFLSWYHYEGYISVTLFKQAKYRMFITALTFAPTLSKVITKNAFFL